MARVENSVLLNTVTEVSIDFLNRTCILKPALLFIQKKNNETTYE